MSFSFAFLCNDAALSTTAQAAFHAELVAEGGAPHGWGLGYYQSGQPLLRKHPQALDSGPLDFYPQMENIRSNIVMGHVRGSAAGGRTNDNTQPFRFRRWLFCHSGTFSGFDGIRSEVSEAIPGFMRRNIHGSTDSEVLFHLFLAFLNDAGRLDDLAVPSSEVARALRSALAYATRLLDQGQAQPSGCCCIASNGRVLVALGRELPLAIARNSSYNNVGRGPDDRPLSYPHLKGVGLVVGRQPPSPGWELVAPEAVVAVNRDLDIEYFGPDAQNSQS